MPLKQASPSSASFDSPPKYILLGEDDPDDEELLVEVFSVIDPSFNLKFVNNGSKLVKTIQSMPDHALPCLIVLDYNMPELNGAEILEVLKSNDRYHKIPKVIWSTSGSDVYKKICLELGACDYLTKPTNIKDLKNTASYLLSFCSV